MPICAKCKIEKSLDEFSNDNHGLNGKSYWCKKCSSINHKKYYQEYKEKIRMDSNKYYREHKIERKKYIKLNKEIISIKHKKYLEDHKEEIKKYRQEHKEQSKKYKLINKEKISLQNKEYYLKNIEKIKNYRKKYRKNNLKRNFKYKLTQNLRNRIWYAIKGKNKSLPTMMLIGCEIDFLMFHLQKQFKDGMSWDNYGKWHVDHIMPCSSFDLSKPEEQIKCFHYSNLQPLWAKDNLVKNAKLDYKNEICQEANNEPL